MDADLDTLATALYVTADDFLIEQSAVSAMASQGRDHPAP